MRHHRCLWTRIKWRLFGRMLRAREQAAHLKETARMNAWDMERLLANQQYRRAWQIGRDYQ